MEDNEVHSSQSSSYNQNLLQDSGEVNNQIFTIVCDLPKSEVSTAQVNHVEVVQGGDDWEVLTSVDIKNAGSKEGKLSQIHYSTVKQLQEVVVDNDAKDHMLLSKKEVMKIPGKDERPNIFLVPDLSSCVDVSFALIEQKDVKREDIKSVCVAKDLNGNYVNRRPSGTKRRSHNCDICSYTTQKRYLLRRHMKSHSDERPFVCNVCERGFKTRAALQNHENVHSGRKPHKCNFCPASFTTSGELARHVRYRHTHEKPHKCPDCDYSAVELGKLKRHMRTHSGERPFQCPQCSYASPDTFKLKRHLRVHTGDKPYECDYCSARFSQLDTLKDHRRTQHLKYKPAFQCELCRVTFAREFDMKKHLKKQHMSEKPLRCNKCGKSFPDRYNLKVHKKTHEGEKCFKCELCPYSSIYHRHLELHMLIHTDEKPLQCDLCDQSFRRKQLLKGHQNLHHNPAYVPPPPKKKTQECHDCGRGFRHKGNLKRHKSRCHPETLESYPETLESVKRQAERAQGYIVQVTQFPEKHLEERTVALDKFESSDSRPFISRQAPLLENC